MSGFNYIVSLSLDRLKWAGIPASWINKTLAIGLPFLEWAVVPGRGLK